MQAAAPQVKPRAGNWLACVHTSHVVRPWLLRQRGVAADAEFPGKLDRAHGAKAGNRTLTTEFDINQNSHFFSKCPISQVSNHLAANISKAAGYDH
jgi:hypothetical protein